MGGRIPHGLGRIARAGSRMVGRETAYDHGLRINAIVSRAERLVLGKKFAKALKVYSRLLEMYPDSPLPRLGVAVALFNLGRRGEAMVECERAMGMEPSYLASYGCGDGVPDGQGAGGRAVSAYGPSVSLNPRYPYYHSSCGDSLYGMGLHEEALAAYVRAVERDPNYDHYHANCGDVLSVLGRHEEALAAHGRAAELRPDRPYHHASCGDELSKLGRHKEAMAAYVRAAQIRPNSAWASRGCADALRALDRNEGAPRG